MTRSIALALAFFLASLASARAVDSTSFDPTTVTITSQSTIAVGTVIAWPSGSNPADYPKWLECDGQAVPSGSRYDRLRAVIGGAVPNYNGQFLRATTDPGAVGQQVAESIKAHSIWVPSVPVTGTASGQTITSGGANSQHFDSWGGQVSYTYSVTENGWGGGFAPGEGGSVSWTNRYMATGSTNSVHTWGDTQGGGIYGATGGGSISGVTASQTIVYNGGSETAPVHTKVRYLIRAIQ